MTILIIGAILLIFASFIIAFKGYGWSGIPALIALWLLGGGTTTLIIWGVTVLLVWGLTMILPPTVAKSTHGLTYMVVGGAAGTLLGMLVPSPGPIVGAVLGVIVGGLAYGATPAGRQMGFPSGQFFNYLAAKGFPAAVTMSLIGQTVSILI